MTGLLEPLSFCLGLITDIFASAADLPNEPSGPTHAFPKLYFFTFFSRIWSGIGISGSRQQLLFQPPCLMMNLLFSRAFDSKLLQVVLSSVPSQDNSCVYKENKNPTFAFDILKFVILTFPQFFFPISENTSPLHF